MLRTRPLFAKMLHVKMRVVGPIGWLQHTMTIKLSDKHHVALKKNICEESGKLYVTDENQLLVKELIVTDGTGLIIPNGMTKKHFPSEYGDFMRGHNICMNRVEIDNIEFYEN